MNRCEMRYHLSGDFPRAKIATRAFALEDGVMDAVYASDDCRRLLATFADRGEALVYVYKYVPVTGQGRRPAQRKDRPAGWQD